MIDLSPMDYEAMVLRNDHLLCDVELDERLNDSKNKNRLAKPILQGEIAIC